MVKEDFVKYLEEKNIKHVIEDGIPIIILPEEEYKKNDWKKTVKDLGYNLSWGLREEN